MKILPFDKYELRTRLSLEELHAAIDTSCEPPKVSASLGGESKPLFGWRNNNEFKLYRAIEHRNSFLPIAYGKIHENGGNVSVCIKLKMSLVVAIFMTFWLSGMLIIFFGGDKGPSLIPIGAIVFGYLLVQVCFWLEVPKLKSLIANIVL